MNTTNFWQIAGLLLSFLQMVLYIAGFIKYKEKLEELADQLTEWADEKFDAYRNLRNKDKDFFDYYDALPDYVECESNIQRSKGAAFADYGKALRRSLPTTRGFTRLHKAAIANHLGQNAVQASAMKRVQTKITERAKVDDHTLQRWQAITNSPTNPAAYNDVSNIIKLSFNSLHSFGQGANSAGAALGVGLYQTGIAS